MPIYATVSHRLYAEFSGGWSPGDVKIRVGNVFVAWPHYEAVAATGGGPVYDQASYARRLHAAWPAYVRCNAHEYLRTYLDDRCNP